MSCSLLHTPIPPHPMFLEILTLPHELAESFSCLINYGAARGK